MNIFVQGKVWDNVLSSAEGREIMIFVYLKLPVFKDRPMQYVSFKTCEIL